MDRRYFFKTLDISINNSLKHKEFISQTDKLIKKFKNLTGIKNASDEELKKVLPEEVVQSLREYLKENGLEGQDGSLNCEWCHLEPQGESLRIR